MHKADDIQIEYVPIDDLRPDPANPRRISDGALAALVRSVKEWGIVRPVLARRADHVVIGGHQTLLAARKLGWTMTPVVFLDLTPKKAQLLGIALNRISGEWDQDLLARLLAELDQSSEADLVLTGFADDEVRDLLRTLDTREKRDRPEQFDLDAVLEAASGSPKTKPGDVWHLGEHQVLCGDSTDANAVSRHLGSGPAQMAFTDPPYNVAYGDHGGQQRGTRRRRIANDAMSPEQWEAFCRGWAANLVANVEGAIYCCMSSKELPLVARVLEETGAHWSDTVIWTKDRFTLGRADYQRQYEPIWYGWREGVSRHWCGDRDQGDVWSIARPSESVLHPTMKPLELVEKAITNSSLPGATVLDLFLGSGTTLIACERTGRVCRGIELDPRYVDVVVARWEAFTGGRAQREPLSE